jgi:hypothetical protein
MGKEFSFEYFHINEKFNKIFIRNEIDIKRKRKAVIKIIR